MNNNTIRDLFFGNLNPFDGPMPKSEEYNKALNEAAEARDALEAEMTDEQKRLLSDYVDKCEMSSCYLQYHTFLVGFQIATRLLGEAIFGNEHE